MHIVPFIYPLVIILLGGRHMLTYVALHIQGVFLKGPTLKSSKYGICPSQQDKIAKYTGPTQSYQLLAASATRNLRCLTFHTLTIVIKRV